MPAFFSIEKEYEFLEKLGRISSGQHNLGKGELKELRCRETFTRRRIN